MQTSYKTKDVIEALIQKTKEKKIYWNYLITKSDLIHISLEICKSASMQIDEGLSFYTKYKNGFFVLINTPCKKGANLDPQIYLIALLPTDFHRPAGSLLNPDLDYQSSLLRLTNLAVRQHPNVEDFIDDFLSDSGNNPENDSES